MEFCAGANEFRAETNELRVEANEFRAETNELRVEANEFRVEAIEFRVETNDFRAGTEGLCTEAKESCAEAMEYRRDAAGMYWGRGRTFPRRFSRLATQRAQRDGRNSEEGRCVSPSPPRSLLPLSFMPLAWRRRGGGGGAHPKMNKARACCPGLVSEIRFDHLPFLASSAVIFTTDTIVTASTGTFWCGPLLVVLTLTISLTTSMPESTRPKTA